MKLPIPTRREYETEITLLKTLVRGFEARIKDLERQFATRYDDAGKVVETLADIPIAERANVRVLRRPKNPMAGMSWQQRKRYLEETDGGRRVDNG